MKIIIIGAGRVGSSVAEALVSEANDITVIDTDGARVAELQSRFDLRGLVGSGALPSILTPVVQQRRRDRLMTTLKFWYRSSNGLSFGARST